MEKKQIENIIINVIEDIVDINITDRNLNLFGDEYHITPRDMTYIVFDIEKKLGKEIVSVFETEDIGIMTISNLADGIKKHMAVWSTYR